MARRLIPDIVSEQTLASTAPDTTVRAAVEIMAARSVGAILVIKGGQLVSIFSERDLALRVVAPGLDPNTVRLTEVATPDPQTIQADATPRQALRLMQRGHFRHLPITDHKGKVLGIVSLGDLYHSVTRSLEDDLVEMSHHILAG